MALQLLGKGFAPVPQLDKRPLIEWGIYRDRLPTEREVRSWPWGKANAIGIVLPARLVVVDFDNRPLGDSFLQHLEERGVKTRINRTRRGCHVYLQTATKVEGVIPLLADGKAMVEVLGKGHLVTWASPHHTPASESPAYTVQVVDVVDLVQFLKPWADTEGLTIGPPKAVNNTKPATSQLEAVLGQLDNVTGPNGSGWYAAQCPFPDHDDANPSFGVNGNGYKCQVSDCAGHTGGSLWQLAAILGLPVQGAPIVVDVSTVRREEVTWLWDKRIPLGRITLFDGDPGIGKSWASLAVAAAVSTGTPLPGDDKGRQPARVLILTAEDGIGDTIRPRLEGMVADLHRVAVLTAVRGEKGQEHHMSLLDDLPALELALQRGGYALVIIDPLNAYLGYSLDTHRDAALRSVLTPLAALAERRRVAVLAIRHLTKSQRDRAIYRGQGSIAYTAAARVVHLVGQHPQHAQQRVVACIKNNLAPLPPALAFEIDELSRFRWLGETDVTPAALLAPEKADDSGALADAKTFLQEELKEGSVATTELKKRATDAGLAWRTVERAKHLLGIAKHRTGFGPGGYWEWSLPKTAADSGASNTDFQRPPEKHFKAAYADSHHENGVPEGGLCEPESQSPDGKNEEEKGRQF